jgi:hypothetical protein
VASNGTMRTTLNKLRAKNRNGKRVELKLMYSNCTTRHPCALCGAFAIPHYGLILALAVPQNYGYNPVCDNCAEKHDPHLFILSVLGREASDAGRDYDFDCEAVASVAEYQKAQDRISLGLPPYIAWQYEHVGQECVRVWEDAAAEHFGLPKPDRRPWWLRTEPEPEPEPEPPREHSALEIECICSWEVAGASITSAA